MKEEQAAVQTAEYIAEDIGTKAYYALLEEVYTTPKPGLVDLYSCGAHTDMDAETFEKSAQALRPWFIRMAAQGYLLTCTREDLFREIRKTGILAEKAMFQATGGVNTHKGMIFTLGIFCGAAGRCMKDYGEIKLKDLIRTEQDMVARIMKKELEELCKPDRRETNGVRNLRQYGTTGIRGEALAGYPSVTEIALPVLMDGLYKEKEWNRIKLQILFALMSRVQDSNILARKNPSVLYEVQVQAMKFLNEGGAYSEYALEKLYLMDARFITANISAGGCAELLVMELPEGSDEQDSAKEILEASEKAMDVVKQISSLSRKNVETVYKCVPVRKMMQRVVKMISSVCPPQVTLESEIQVQEECILGNTTQLNQVILNICVNAVHAIGKKEGNIFIKCEVITTARMEAVLEKDLPDTWKNYIFISIRDNGCGMDKDTMRQIFDPFFTTKKGGEGTGLGLALAEQIITSHKGYIFAESSPGKGSTFHIGIPVLDGEQIQETAIVSEKREIRMIFADDNAKVLELLRKNFEKIGIKIITCITLEEVSQNLKAQEADVLVVEENIEGKSGVDFCMTLVGKYPDMLRLVSIDSISREILEAQRKGIIHGYIEKPMSDRSVLEAVRECRKQM